jgi:hypothetical protein
MAIYHLNRFPHLLVKGFGGLLNVGTNGALDLLQEFVDQVVPLARLVALDLQNRQLCISFTTLDFKRSRLESQIEIKRLTA